jgi:choline dehydrogenase-like flavoprotein
MGTARMSEDPQRGVTDSFGAVHGVPGLFIADASLFPGPLGINPMETVIALAMRNAQRILEALLPDGDRTARYVDVALGAARAADRALRLQVRPERNG